MITTKKNNTCPFFETLDYVKTKKTLKESEKRIRSAATSQKGLVE
jgi:hypothetical protein